MKFATSIFAALVLLGPTWSAAAETYPLGDTPHNETLVLPYTIGGKLQGAGDGQYTDQLAKRNMSALVRDNGDLSPLFVVPGRDWDVSGFTLCGAKGNLTWKTDDDVPLEKLPVAGFVMQPGGTNFNNGRHRFHDLTIMDCQTAFQIGRPTDDEKDDPKYNSAKYVKDAGCDTSDFENIGVLRCGAIARTYNDQSMSNHFRVTDCANIADGFVFYAGGRFTSEDLFVGGVWGGYVASAIHLVGTTDAETGLELGIGKNNAEYHLIRANYDNRCGNRMRDVTMDKHFPTAPSILVSGGLIQHEHYRYVNANAMEGSPETGHQYNVKQAEPRYLYVLRNPFELVIEHRRNLPAGSILYLHDPKYPPGRIRIEGCSLHWRCGAAGAWDLIAPESDGEEHLHFTARDNYLHNGGQSLKDDERRPK
ncbi:MAG: hypothetical protein M5U26_15200 [Planctomycetota bacterium]|nr:hypothetical protein [Planctomycetota bacterium]